MPRLQNKIFIVTGAAHGLGRATAEAYVKEGAKVVIADINCEAGIAAANDLGDAAPCIHLDSMSARIDQNVDRTGGATVRRFGCIGPERCGTVFGTCYRFRCQKLECHLCHQYSRVFPWSKICCPANARQLGINYQHGLSCWKESCAGNELLCVFQGGRNCHYGGARTGTCA